MWHKTAVYGLVTGLVITILLLSGCLCSALLESLLGDSGESPTSRAAPRSSSTPAVSSSSDETGFKTNDDSDLPVMLNWPPKGPPPDPALRSAKTGQLTLGTAVSLGSQDIPATGGSFRVSKPGDPLDGLALTIPSGAYNKARTFRISSAPINGCTFRDVSPATPLISIDNGGEFAEQIMTLKIPVKVKPGQFAMGFFYDAKSGRLEGIPLAAEDENSITVATRHFSDVFAGLFDEANLNADIKSGFMPSWDDWEFPNWGSYIEPGGHCAGQSITAMWYYTEKPDGRDPGNYLNNRYDNNGEKPLSPNFWLDDSRAYRLASVVQHDIQWDSLANKLMYALGGLNDKLTWLSIASAMKSAGEPQAIGIYSSAGGGHALVCYRIVNGTLYVADPNYPGRTDRRIEWDQAAGKFKPYNSAANSQDMAAGKGKAYERITYFAKGAEIPWSKVASRWAEMKAGTIGNNIFPDYKITYRDAPTERYRELPDGLVVTNPQFDISDYVSRTVPSCVRVYRDGVLLKWDRNWTVTLVEGPNQLGVYNMGEASRRVRISENQTELRTSLEYIDFKYLTVNYYPLVIDPKVTDIVTGETVRFTAGISGKVPGITWKWKIGSNPYPDTAGVFTHTFDSTGSYSVTATAYESSGRKLGEITSKVTVTAATIGILTISPSSWTGEVMQEQRFTATSAKPPAKAVYEWYLGSERVSYDGKNTLLFQWGGAPGTYKLLVKEFDASVNPYRVTATGSIQVTLKVASAPNILPELQKFKGLFVRLDGPFTLTNTTSPLSSLNIPCYDWDGSRAVPITWNGVNFSGKRTDGSETGNFANYFDDIKGTVSADGQTLLRLEYNYREIYNSTGPSVAPDKRGNKAITIARIVLEKVPLYSGKAGAYVQNGSGIQKYVAELQYARTSYDASGKVTSENKLSTSNWSDKTSRIALDFK